MMETAPASEPDFARARRAVDLGWVTREQVEAAILSHERDPGSRILSKLPLTPEQVRELEGSDGATILSGGATAAARSTLPPEVAEAVKDPKRRVGRFVLVNLLGKGGMGMVFRGWEPELRQWVALKFLKQIGDDTARAYFKREAQLAAGLDHPNIAKIYEIGEHEGQPFIAMQFVDGAPLSGKDLKLEEKIRIVRAIAEAVKYAHERKVIHRDLKPANVMIDKHGQVYVMDFGLAKETAVEGESLGGSSLVVGTPSYMAPEQAKGKANQQSDVYGIGAILYELVTGRPPFTGETSTDVIMQVVTQEPMWPRKLSPAIPQDVEAIILHALEKDPTRRYESASRLIDDLDAFAQKNPLRHALRPTLTYVLGKKIRKQPLLWTATAMMILAILGGATFGTWQLLRAKSEAERRASVEADKADAERRARVEVETERDRTDAQRRIAEEQQKRAEKGEASAKEKLAYGYVLRGRQAEAAGDDACAALLYVTAYATYPSELSRALAVQSVRRPPALINVLRHDDSISAVAFSPGGKSVATASSDKTVRLWDTQTGEPVGKVMRHDDRVRCVAFSPDRKRIATGSEDRTARLWDAETGETAGKPMRHDKPVGALAFSPDGKRLATASEDGTARLWDAVTGEPIGKVMRHDDGVYVVAFSPDGKRIATGGSDNTGRIWEGETGEPLASLPRFESYVSYVAFSPDGKRILTNSNNTVTLWDAQSCGPVGKPMRHSNTIASMAFSPNGRRIATGSLDRTVRLWDAETGEPVGKVMRHEHFVDSLAFSPDGKRLATASQDKTTRLWDGVSGEPLGIILRHQHAVYVVSFSSDGKRLITGSWSGTTASLWDVEPFEPAARILLDSRSIHGVVFSPNPNRKTFAALDSDDTARLWNSESGDPIGKVIRHPGINSIKYSPDGNRLVTGSLDGTARLWDSGTGESIGRVMQQGGWGKAFAFSPDGKCLVTVGSSSGAHTYDGETGEPMGKALPCDDSVRTVAFSPDGCRLATGSNDKTARLWDWQGCQPLGKIMPHNREVFDVRFSPDGKWLMTEDADGRRYFWNAETGDRLDEIGRRIGGGVIAFSPDAERIVGPGANNTARLLDARSVEPLGAAMPHDDRVCAVAFSPDGKWVITGSEDKTARLWDGETGEPPALPLRHGQAVIYVAFCPDGKHVVTLAKDRMQAGNTQLMFWDVSFLTEKIPPEVLLHRVQVRKSLRLTPRGEAECIPSDEWRTLKKKLQEEESSR